MSTLHVPQLPHLGDIFERLRRGQHLCPEDGTPYFTLEEHEGAFRNLFEQLGFNLVLHPRSFYYFRGTDRLSTTAERMAIFVLILIEHLAETTDHIEQHLMSEAFRLDALPHLKKDRYAAYMKEVGVSEHDDLINVMRNLELYGFAERDEDALHFRTPAYRFFDLCMEAIRDDVSTAQVSGDSCSNAAE